MEKKYVCFLMAGITLLTGCASYNAPPLSNLTVECVKTCPQQAEEGVCEDAATDVIVAAKQFDRVDCMRFLDRDVLAKGYQPIQLYIQNNSGKSYRFSLNRLELPCATANEVAQKVHTSTVGRAVGYGVGALFLWPLAIPAIVDGIKSAKANDALDCDFAAKTARDQTIAPHSYFNKIVFVPLQDYQPCFNVVLMDLESNQPEAFPVTVR